MMSLAQSLRSETFQKVALILSAFLVLWLLVGTGAVLIYALSYGYHLLNLQAFLFRRYDPRAFVVHSLLLRCVALVTLGVLMLQYAGTPVNLYALIPLALGVALHAAAVGALGLERTYYAVELGGLPPAVVRSFPYNVLAHPMELGAALQFVGLYYLLPQFTRDYPYLVLGHLAFTCITALVEQFDLHFKDYFFTAFMGKFSDDSSRQTIDSLRDWSLEHFRTHLHQECSMHRYVKTLPADVIGQIDRVRYADQVLSQVRAAFPRSKLIPLPMTDEIYISRYNIDRGGDQGLFDKHHDGNLRFFPGASVVRSLIYLSSYDHLEIVFDSSGKQANMKTYDFGLLDFHKELHWVNGSYDPNNPPRILLKCNYYVDHTGLAPWRWLGISLNVGVFYVVKAAMEYSKSPKTVMQRAIGIVCNLFRRLNNLSPAAPIVLIAAVLALSVRMVAFQLAYLF